MNKHTAQEEERSLPLGWPKDTTLPTLSEAEAAVRQVGQKIVQFAKEDRDKLRRPDSERETITFDV